MIKFRNKYVEKIVVLSFTILICLALLEIGLRMTGRSASNIYQGEYEQYKDFYRLKKNFVKINEFSTYSYSTITNSYGARDKEIRSFDINEKPYVVFLGASQVFGQGVDYEDTFVGVFANYADSVGVEVLNMAVGGHFLLEQEMIFKELLDTVDRKPSLVILGVSASSLNWHDTCHSTLDPIMVKSGYLFYKNSWKLAYIRLLIKNTLSIYDFFRDVFWKFNARMQFIGAEDRLPKHFKLYSNNSRLNKKEEIEKAEEHLKRFEDYCSEKDIILAYLFVPLIDSFRLYTIVEELGDNPSNYNTSLYEDFIIRYCRRNGSLLFNPKPELLEHYNEGKKLMHDRDPHYNVYGNRIVGDYLIEEVFINHGLF